jgi:hypothetical protein
MNTQRQASSTRPRRRQTVGAGAQSHDWGNGLVARTLERATAMSSAISGVSSGSTSCTACSTESNRSAAIMTCSAWSAASAASAWSHGGCPGSLLRSQSNIYDPLVARVSAAHRLGSLPDQPVYSV